MPGAGTVDSTTGNGRPGISDGHTSSSSTMPGINCLQILAGTGSGNFSDAPTANIRHCAGSTWHDPPGIFPAPTTSPSATSGSREPARPASASRTAGSAAPHPCPLLTFLGFQHPRKLLAETLVRQRLQILPNIPASPKQRLLLPRFHFLQNSKTFLRHGSSDQLRHLQLSELP